MIKSLNLLSPTIQSIVEQTLIALPGEIWAELPEEQLNQIAKDLEFAFRNKMVTTVWRVCDFSSFLDSMGLSYERKELIARRAMVDAEKHFDPDAGLCREHIRDYVYSAKQLIEHEEAHTCKHEKYQQNKDK